MLFSFPVHWFPFVSCSNVGSFPLLGMLWELNLVLKCQKHSPFSPLSMKGSSWPMLGCLPYQSGLCVRPQPRWGWLRGTATDWHRLANKTGAKLMCSPWGMTGFLLPLLSFSFNLLQQHIPFHQQHSWILRHQDLKITRCKRMRGWHVAVLRLLNFPVQWGGIWGCL